MRRGTKGQRLKKGREEEDVNVRTRACSDAVYVVHVSEHAGRAYVNDIEMMAA